MMSTTEKLGNLSPTQFEHFVYDLARERGVQDLEWRTPGADGGRDLQGYFVYTDPAGRTRREKWYIECKRYASSVDWATVYGKLAYATNHDADVLLLCTTSHLSPPCKTEVAIHNTSKRAPHIVAWEGQELEYMSWACPWIRRKHGLPTDGNSSTVDLEELAQLMCKCVGSVDPDIAIESRSVGLLVALTEVMARRLADCDASRPGRAIDWDVDVPSFVTLQGGGWNNFRFSGGDVRVILALARFFGVAGTEIHGEISAKSSAIHFRVETPPASLASCRAALNAVQRFLEFDVEVDQSGWVLVGRRSDHG